MGSAATLERIKRIQEKRSGTTSQKSQLDPSDAKCHLCDDLGSVAVIKATGEVVSFSNPVLQATEHEAKVCQCVADRRVSGLFHRNYLSEACKDASFQSFKTDDRPACVKEALRTALNYLKHFEEIRWSKHNGLMFIGAPGTGKTYLIQCVCRGLMERGIAVQHFEFIAGFDDLRSDLSKLNEKKGALKDAPVLFIDDLFQGRDIPTGFVADHLFDIVDHRVTKRLPILVSSNRTLTQLYEINQYIAERLYFGAKGHRIMMDLTPEERASGMKLSYRMLTNID